VFVSIQVTPVNVRDPSEIERDVAAFARLPNGGLIVTGSALAAVHSGLIVTGFDVHEMHCKVLIARANKRGDYLAKSRCDDNLIQSYWFSLFKDRLYISETDREP